MQFNPRVYKKKLLEILKIYLYERIYKKTRKKLFRIKNRVFIRRNFEISQHSDQNFDFSNQIFFYNFESIYTERTKKTVE